MFKKLYACWNSLDRAELEEKVFSLQKLLQETKVGLNKMREENEKVISKVNR